VEVPVEVEASIFLYHVYAQYVRAVFDYLDGLASGGSSLGCVDAVYGDVRDREDELRPDVVVWASCARYCFSCA
jgi:hypothetical protein